MSILRSTVILQIDFWGCLLRCTPWEQYARNSFLGVIQLMSSMCAAPMTVIFGLSLDVIFLYRTLSSLNRKKSTINLIWQCLVPLPPFNDFQRRSFFMSENRSYLKANSKATLVQFFSRKHLSGKIFFGRHMTKRLTLQSQLTITWLRSKDPLEKSEKIVEKYFNLT